MVAPFVGAWIETDDEIKQYLMNKGRSFRRSVD